jgi:RNA polymerase sigma-70 factor (ECF subfamily)
MIRKKSKEIGCVSIDDEEGFMQFADELTVEDDLLTNETRRILFEAIDALGIPDSEIITRKFFFRESSASIAQRLGTSVSNIDTRTHRALKKLRERIGGNVK